MLIKEKTKNKPNSTKQKNLVLGKKTKTHSKKVS